MNDRRSPRLDRRRLLVAAGAAAVAGCLDDGDDASDTGDDQSGTDDDGAGDGRVSDDYEHPMPSADPDWAPAAGPPATDVTAETLVENLEIPWDITFTSDGELFLTERTGTILRFDAGDVAEVASPRDAIDAGAVEPGTDDRPWWVEGGEGGTLGIAAHPNYPDPSYIYVYYTANGDGPRNRVVRYDVTASAPAETEEIIVGDIPAETIHNGGRIAFGPDDNLWVCTGDAGEGALARDVDSLAGKILRVSPEGEPLETNPDLGGDPRVFTYGHRNPQGISWLPSGVPVINEHGPSARDEFQVLRPGEDYGWNVVRGGPDDDTHGSYTEYDDVVPPVINTGSGTAWAPTGSTFYTGEGVPSWHNRYVVGGLISQSVFVVTLTPTSGEPPSADGQNAWRYDEDWLDDAYAATAHQVLQDELGRVRHVTQSPDGDLYAITSNRDGRASGPFPRDRDDVLVRLRT